MSGHHHHGHGHGQGHAHGHGRLGMGESSKITRRITLIASGVAAVLIAIKAVAWSLSGSVAVLASLVDSTLDLAASLIAAFAVRYAAKAPDEEHRFGHGKAEAFSSLIQAGIVFASAALVGREAIDRMIDPRPVTGEGVALAVMAVSTVLTIVLIVAQTRALRETGSVAVEGDRAHYAADTASNLVAFLGIGAAALTGQLWVDALAGLLVAAWLVWGAISVFRGASSQLMDSELSDEARAEIVELATADGRIEGVHSLRTRASGPIMHIQLHADLDPAMSLYDAHEAILAAEARILEAFPAADILIHPDPKGRAGAHGKPR